MKLSRIVAIRTTFCTNNFWKKWECFICLLFAPLLLQFFDSPCPCVKYQTTFFLGGEHHKGLGLWLGLLMPKFQLFNAKPMQIVGQLRGYWNYFLTSCVARRLKSLPISNDFSSSKNGWFFASRDPFQRVFFYLTNGWLYKFFAIFVKWNSFLRIFLDQNGTHV